MAVRAFSRLTRRAFVLPYVLTVAIFIGLAVAGGARALAQSAVPASPAPTALGTPAGALGAISGVVKNPEGVSLGGADVTLDGPTRARTKTNGDGTFTFTNLVPGLYSVTVSRGSFVTVTRTDVAVLAGAPLALTVEMQPATFTSLREIAHVTVSSGGLGTINTSPAAVSDIPSQVFADQGQQQVVRVLNQTPGIITTVQNFGFNNNGAYQSMIQEPQIRGCLSYETESLIDGHPISIGSSGFYTPLYLNTHILQSVEIVKGPGSMPTDINYAVCGSVNYRTLEPTRNAQAAASFDLSTYGGLSSSYQATGTTSNGRLGYAFAYAIVGQPGPFSNDKEYSGTLNIAPGTKINGQPICGPTLPSSVCSGSFPATPPGQTGALAISYPIVICCSSLTSIFTGKTELGKLRYNFSPETSLTVSYLGAQAYQSLYTNYIFPQQSFDPYNPSYAAFGLWPTPSTGLYKGALPPGFGTPYATLVNFATDSEQNQQGLFSSEFRTNLGKATFLARYYTGAQQDIIYGGNPNGTGINALTGQVWGLLPTGPAGTFQSYNGQNATITQPTGGTASLIQDHFSGYSAEVNIPAGSNLYAVSYDRTQHHSIYNFAGTTLVPDGASQSLSTVMVRGLFQLTPQLTALFGNYFIGYTSHYTPDGGATWADASHSFYGPRLALTWQPRTTTSVRVSAGASIAPPFFVLINTAGGPPFANNQGAVLYYTQIVNNGKISPETAFGYDVGADQRFANNIIVSGDLYQTNLHGQFLSTTRANGTYTAPSGPNAGKTRPLYISETANLGQSRYQGVELSVREVPQFGLGFTVQGALIRAYTFDLPPGFHDTAAGPNTTNLAIVNNANYFTGGNGYNGIADGNVPYAQGYGELNYRLKNGTFYLLGATYFGNNNSYDAPAFFVLSASARFPLNKNMNVQVTCDNLTGTLSARAANLFGGLPVPLVNGTVGVTTGFNIGPPVWHLILNMNTTGP
jgi:hypothetical protein